jgi:hypothetical protein
VATQDSCQWGARGGVGRRRGSWEGMKGEIGGRMEWVGVGWGEVIVGWVDGPTCDGLGQTHSMLHTGCSVEITYCQTPPQFTSHHITGLGDGDVAWVG